MKNISTSLFVSLRFTAFENNFLTIKVWRLFMELCYRQGVKAATSAFHGCMQARMTMGSGNNLFKANIKGLFLCHS